MKTSMHLLTLLAASAFAADPHVDVPVPTVTGPVAWTAQPPDASHGYTFNRTFLDLSHAGYVEEEFFIEGTANRYNLPAEATGSVIDSGPLQDAHRGAPSHVGQEIQRHRDRRMDQCHRKPRPGNGLVSIF
jgi:hypothetical protein